MRILLILFLLAFFLNVFSQQEKIQEIKDYYYDIKTWINAKDPDSLMYSGYYHDVKMRNVNNSPWRAVGIYNDTTHYYYNDEMEAENREGNTENSKSWALVLVIESSQHSIMFHYREWLYEDGKLLFYYDRFTGYDEESTYEYRYYFDDKKLIQFMDGSEIKEFEDDLEVIFNSAESKQAEF